MGRPTFVVNSRHTVVHFTLSDTSSCVLLIKFIMLLHRREDGDFKTSLLLGRFEMFLITHATHKHNIFIQLYVTHGCAVIFCRVEFLFSDTSARKIFEN